MQTESARPKDPTKTTLGHLLRLLRDLPLPALGGLLGTLATVLAAVFYGGWAAQGIYTTQQRNDAIKDKDTAVKERDELAGRNKTLTEELSLAKTAGLTPSPNGTNTRMLSAVDRLGIAAIWPPGKSREEDDQVRAYIKSSRTIRIIAYTGESFARVFEQELREFFSTDGNKVEVLLADPSDSFYQNNTRMTLKTPGLAPSGLAAFNENQVQAIARLRKAQPRPGQLEVRMFTNQMRLPAIIFDNACILTVRLPPAEDETVRVEFVKTDIGYFRRCSDYFNTIWADASQVDLESLRKK